MAAPPGPWDPHGCAGPDAGRRAAPPDATTPLLSREALVELNRRYQVMLDSVSDVVLCLDSEGRLTHISESARTLLGHDPRHWQGRHAFDLVHPDDLALVIENFEATVDMTADSSPMTVRVRSTAGCWVPYEVYADNQLHDPVVAAVVVAMRDVTEREEHIEELRAAHAALELAERQFRLSFDHAPIGMALVGPGGRFVRVNAALCEIAGYDEAAMLDRTFQQITHPDDLAADLELVQQLVHGERTDYEVEKRYLRGDGSEIWVQVNVTMVRDERGQPMHFMAQVQDVTERRRLHAALIEQANRDALTGLANRACFEVQLTEACATVTEDGSLTVMFVDLDDFKEVNDTFGHIIGDEVLRTTANRVRRVLRSGDLAARFGGDELALILRGAIDADADRLAARLRAAIAEPFDVGADRSLTLSASIGHATTHVSGDTRDLLSRADAAMYADKRSRTADG